MAEGQAGGDSEVHAWQTRLLPFMVGAIVCMALFFFAASLWQLYEFRSETHVEAMKPDDLLPPSGAVDEQAEFRTRVKLETVVVSRRYEQVRAVLLLRAWTRYVGFLTGMIIALVGAVFVLGKLGEGGKTADTKLTGEGAGFKASLQTPYPGVMLAALGTILMGITLVVPFEFETRDVPVYFGPHSQPPKTMPPPGPWPAASAQVPAQLKAEEEELFPDSMPPREEGKNDVQPVEPNLPDQPGYASP